MVEVIQFASRFAVELMATGSKNGTNGERKSDWACLVANALLAGKKAYINPKHHKDQLIGYGSKNECKHGHPKGTSHLCAWHDVEAKFKEREAAKPISGAAPKGPTNADKKLQDQNKRLEEQNKKQGEELKKIKAAASGKTSSDDADGDESMEPQDGSNEKDKRALIKSRVAM